MRRKQKKTALHYQPSRYIRTWTRFKADGDNFFLLRFRASPHLFITLKLLAAVDISTTLRSFAIWCVVPSREKSRSRVNYYTITHDERERERAIEASR